MRMPSLSSSPRMRSAPQRGLRHAISRMSATRFVGGRADRRERRRQNARNPAQCQRRMVAGWMSRVASRQAGATRAARTIVKRCQGVQRTRPATFRSAAMSCCRRSAFSANSSMRQRTRSAASPETNRRRSITCRVLHRPRADGICSQDPFAALTSTASASRRWSARKTPASRGCPRFVPSWRASSTRRQGARPGTSVSRAEARDASEPPRSRPLCLRRSAQGARPRSARQARTRAPCPR